MVPGPLGVRVSTAFLPCPTHVPGAENCELPPGPNGDPLRKSTQVGAGSGESAAAEVAEITGTANAVSPSAAAVMASFLNRVLILVLLALNNSCRCSATCSGTSGRSHGS